MTSAVCQEFGCLPDEADRQDVARIKRIMSLRRYAEVKAHIDAGAKMEEIPQTSMLETVLKVQVKRARGELD